MFSPRPVNQLVFNREYRDALDNNFKGAALEINRILTELETLYRRLDTVLIHQSGSSNPEVIAARISKYGFEHPSLYAHLDAIETGVELNQKTIQDVYDYQEITKKYINLETTSKINIYVNSVNGSDDNTGDITAPFKTIQKAIEQIPLLTLGNTYTVNIANGVYDEDLVIMNRFGGAIYLTGNPDAPTNVKIKSLRCVDLYSYLNISGIQAVTTIQNQFLYDRCSYVNTNRCIGVDNNKGVGASGANYSASQGVVTGCTFSNGECGIVVNTNSQVTIEDSNTGSNNNYGIRSGRSVIHKIGKHTLTGSIANESFYAGGIISNGGIIGS